MSTNILKFELYSENLKRDMFYEANYDIRTKEINLFWGYTANNISKMPFPDSRLSCMVSCKVDAWVNNIDLEALKLTKNEYPNYKSSGHCCCH